MNNTIIWSGFGRVPTLGNSDPTILEGVESSYDIYESGLGRVSTLGTRVPAIPNEENFPYVEGSRNSMLVDHAKNA